jgi:hypothetical protein
VPRLPLLLIAAASLLPRPATALELARLHTWDGAAQDGQFSFACVVLGDMDGDGFADFAIAASADPTAGQGAGRVFVFRGGVAHLGDPPALVIDGAAGDLLGTSLAAVGDVDGDGLADLLIGAPGSTDVHPGATGRALLVFGSSLLGSRAPAGIPGPLAGGGFGAAVAGLGDWNGDGHPDFAIGAPRANAEAGEVLVYLGGPGVPGPAVATLHGKFPGDEFGAAVAGAGRTRGGSFADLIVGAPLNSDVTIWAGKTYLYFGGAVPDTTADRTWAGAGFGDFFGTSVAGAGDVNGDGRDDVLVGAPGVNVGPLVDAGQAYLFLGAPAPPTSPALAISGTAASDEMGIAVAGIGDIDGDGFKDFAAGAPGGADSSTLGSVQVFRGRATPSASPDSLLSGESAGDMFGHTISNGGPITGATHDVFLVGSYLHGGPGRAYLYGMPPLLLSVPPSLAPPAAGIALAPPWPLPAAERVHVAFELARSTSLRLDIVDVNGRLAAHAAAGEYAAGRHELVWPAGGGAPPAGVYFAVLTAGPTRLARRFVVLGR